MAATSPFPGASAAPVRTIAGTLQANILVIIQVMDFRRGTTQAEPTVGKDLTPVANDTLAHAAV